MKSNPKDPQTWLSPELFAAYCGTKSDRLMRYYDKSTQKKKMVRMSLNWFAILFLPAWYGYRRQWSLVGLIVFFFTLIPFVESYFSLNVPATSMTGGLIAVGLLSNGFLLTNAQNEYLKLKKNGSTDSEIKETLTDKASRSLSGAVIAGVLSILLPVGASVIASLWLG